MPDLANSLRTHDLEQLGNIAELWGVDLSAPDARRALPLLTQAILEPQLISEVVAALPEPARLALAELQTASGRLPWPQFTRRFGEVREMGPARLARIQPHRNPASTAEILWYRAMLARAFFDTPSGPQEFAFIPEDLLALIPDMPAPRSTQLGRPAREQERAHRITVSGAIVDHACTLLAGLRSGFSFERIAALAPEILPPPKVLAAVLKTAGLVDAQSFPHPENARRFLEEPRSEALSRLGRAWLSSDTFNDLRMIPHLEAEGGWQNQPEPARQKVLSMLNEVPPEKWWHLPSFIDAVNRHHPDFQRPAGDYDSWYIKDARTGAYLRGFHHWQDVEGELIRWMVTSPLHWFAAVDLATPAAGSPAAAFRLTSLFELLLSGRAFPEVPPEESELHIDSKGQLALPSGFPRDARYQIARFCDWEPPRKGAYRYRLTPAALERARAQELTVKQLIALLRKHSAAKIPPNILSALKRWDSHGAQARLEQVVILRLSAPAILKALQSSRAARFLGDPIGPAAVLVKPGAQQNVLDALAELGYLGQADLASGEPIDD